MAGHSTHTEAATKASNIINTIIDKSFANTEFERLNLNADLGVSLNPFNSKTISELTCTAFKKIAFYFREAHLKLLCDILKSDSPASSNDRFVVKSILENARIAAKGKLCLCQDGGTACVYVWMDQGITTDVDPIDAINAGVEKAYSENNLRSSILCSENDFFCEKNTLNNLPAQIKIESRMSKDSEQKIMRFLFVAKGGGSANKTSLWAMPPSILEHNNFDEFLHEKINDLGTSACPPYRLAVVVGGLSPEENLNTLKLASTEILDSAPYRDKFWEDRAMEIASLSGIGAQAGGSSLCLDAKVLRLMRHAASCFVSIGVSCCAHRNALGYISGDGVFLERLCECAVEEAPFQDEDSLNSAIKIKLNRPIKEICRELKTIEKQKMILLSGKIITARDAAHKKWHALIAGGKPLPQYLFDYPVFYAGPSTTPPGKICGSIGPTTAQRMDFYCSELFSRGLSLLTIAKGKRGTAFYEAAQKWGAVYLCAIGGTAALISEKNILSATIIDYPELEMEAVRLLEVKDLPVFIS